ncbi:hypothetical protein D3C77_599140 [compost metagenome]
MIRVRLILIIIYGLFLGRFDTSGYFFRMLLAPYAGELSIFFAESRHERAHIGKAVLGGNFFDRQ